jgi:hypothetical protein
MPSGEAFCTEQRKRNNPLSFFFVIHALLGPKVRKDMSPVLSNCVSLPLLLHPVTPLLPLKLFMHMPRLTRVLSATALISCATCTLRRLGVKASHRVPTHDIALKSPRLSPALIKCPVCVCVFGFKAIGQSLVWHRLCTSQINHVIFMVLRPYQSSLPSRDLRCRGPNKTPCVVINHTPIKTGVRRRGQKYQQAYYNEIK